ncbi:MAG: hypothetical protein KKF89_00625, partial [Nanoarchaeota archaeon]|nr:hypothetical protein [Nanoarchaeota archaeon]
MKELNKQIERLELEIKLLHSSKSALTKERRKKNISKKDYEFYKQIREDTNRKTAYIKEIETKLTEAKIKLKEEQDRQIFRQEKLPAIALATIIVLMLSLSIISNYEGITGAVVFTKEDTFIKTINQTFKEDTTIDLNITNATSLSITGNIMGEGRVKILLDINGTLFTVMDKITSTTEGGNLITGFVVDELETIVKNTTEEQNTTIEELIEEEVTDENSSKEVVQENTTIEEPETIIENITLEKNTTI